MPKSKIYTKFMMIGYEIPTARSDPGTEYTLDLSDKDPTIYPTTKYLYVPDSLSNTDARIRLKRLAGVVDRAKSLIQRADQENTLKIFMAPEFFFRPKAAITQRINFLGFSVKEPSKQVLKSKDVSVRAYTEETHNEIYSTLAAMFSHADFADWVFIPGSIVYVHHTQSLNLLDLGTRKLFVRNQAIVVRGGKTKDAIVTVVDKVNVSPADSISESEWRRDCFAKSMLGSMTGRRQALFTIDGIDFGLEICMDHNQKVLKKTCLDFARLYYQGRPEPVDLHLLINNTQRMLPAALVARQGGHVLREDGSPNLAEKPFTQIEGVTRLSWKDGIEDRAEATTVGGGLGAVYYSDTLPKELKIDAGSKTSYKTGKLETKSMDEIHPQRITWSLPIRLPH